MNERRDVVDRDSMPSQVSRCSLVAPLLCLLLSACFSPTYLGESPKECGAPLVVDFEGLTLGGDPRHGQHSASQLYSLCGSAGCDASKPLAVAADHGFYVMLEQGPTELTPDPALLSLRSSDPSVLSLGPSRAMSGTHHEDLGGDCESSRRVWVESEMHALAAGNATLELRRGEELIDEYPIVVDAPTRVEVWALTAQKPSEPVTSLRVEAADKLLILYALAYGATAELVLHPEQIHWRVSDPAVLEFFASTADGLSMRDSSVAELDGAGVTANVHQIGRATVSATVNDVTQPVDLEVFGIPEDQAWILP
jgi:hypothetical protein